MGNLIDDCKVRPDFKSEAKIILDFITKYHMRNIATPEETLALIAVTLETYYIQGQNNIWLRWLADDTRL